LIWLWHFDGEETAFLKVRLGPEGLHSVERKPDSELASADIR
jgi:hypothetical protein